MLHIRDALNTSAYVATYPGNRECSCFTTRSIVDKILEVVNRPTYLTDYAVSAAVIRSVGPKCKFSELVSQLSPVFVYSLSGESDSTLKRHFSGLSQSILLVCENFANVLHHSPRSFPLAIHHNDSIIDLVSVCV